jgi:hypothetical protein
VRFSCVTQANFLPQTAIQQNNIAHHIIQTY